MFLTRLMDLMPRPFQASSDDLFMVLSSQFCGDVSWLVGAGIQEERIVAVDIDAAACEAVKARFPRVRVFHGDVVDAAHTYDGRVAVAFLDFCNCLSFDMRAKLSSVAKRLFRGRERGLLGVGFQRARERVDGKYLIRSSRLARGPNSEPARVDARGRDPFEEGRAQALQDALNGQLSSSGWVCFQGGGVAYQGRRVPMQLAAYDIVPKELVGAYLETHGEVVEHEGDSVLLKNPSRTWASLRLGFVTFDERGELCPAADSSLNDEDPLRRQVLALARVIGVVAASRRFNVQMGTVAAWMAHDTRGTYASEVTTWTWQDIHGAKDYWDVADVPSFFPEQAMFQSLGREGRVVRQGRFPRSYVEIQASLARVLSSKFCDSRAEAWGRTADNLEHLLRTGKLPAHCTRS